MMLFTLIQVLTAARRLVTEFTTLARTIEAMPKSRAFVFLAVVAVIAIITVATVMALGDVGVEALLRAALDLSLRPA